MEQEFQSVYILYGGSLLKNLRESVTANVVMVVSAVDD